MAVEWGRDYHSGDSPYRIVEATYPVSVHLSTRPFGPDRCSSLRPHCGMTAEFTENLTLSRAHALGDSPWSLERRSLAAPWGPAIGLLRMRLAAIRSGMQRIGYAIRGVFRYHCLIY